jgi:hypothetical protein
MDRNAISEIIIDTLRSFDFVDPDKLRPVFNETTVLFGNEGLFDSIGLVTFILDVEENIRSKSGISITLADQRAMSQSKSPFRRVSLLADYAAQLIAEQSRN